MVVADPSACEIVVVVPPEVVNRACSLLDTVNVIAETRPSIYGAMNDGVSASTGKYLYFLGKDDILLPAFLGAMSLLRQGEPSAVFCDVYWGDRGLYSGSPSRWKVLARNFSHQGIIYSREVFRRHGPFSRRMRVQADHLLNIKLLWDREFSARVRYACTPVAWYSGSGFSTTTNDPVFWRLYPLVMRRYVGVWAACLLISYRKLRGR